MARSKKQKIEINNNDSLQGLMQEVYNNACNQLNDSQKVINEIAVAASPQDVDDYAKIATSKINALKLKDSAIKIKLDVGKLQNEIIKHSGSLTEGSTTSSGGSVVTSKDFSQIREIIKKQTEEAKNSDTEG